MGKVIKVDFKEESKYIENPNKRSTKSRASEFRERYSYKESKQETIKRPRNKKKLKAKNPRKAQERREDIKRKNTPKQDKVVIPRIPKEYYDEEPLKRPRQPKKKIASKATAIATSIAIAGSGLAAIIYKNVSDKNHPIDVTEAMLTMNDKNTIGLTDEILNEATELSYLMNDIENVPNSTLINISKQISDFQSDTLEEKISSLLGVNKEDIRFERGYVGKTGDHVPAKVKLRDYSSITHSSNASYILPSKVDDYIAKMDDFKEIAENIETSDIDRDNLINKLQKEFKMGKDMLNQMFTINEEGIIKVNPITSEMLWNYRIPEDEER